MYPPSLSSLSAKLNQNNPQKGIESRITRRRLGLGGMGLLNQNNPQKGIESRVYAPFHALLSVG